MTLSPPWRRWLRAVVPERLRGLVRKHAPRPAKGSVHPTDPLGDLIAREQALWRKAVARAQDGPNVLIATSLGGFAPATTLESMLAVALTLRGARVRMLLCDKMLPACQQTYKMPPDPTVLNRYELKTALCDGCFDRGSRSYGRLGLKVSHYGEYLSAAERDEARTLAHELPAAEIPTWRRDGRSIGEHALAGALRFFARGQLPPTPEAETALRRYFEAALLASRAAENLLRRESIDRVCLHHAIYVPQGLIAQECRHAGVPLATWNVAYRKGCFIFSHGDTYHHTMLAEPTAAWQNMPWGPQQEREVMDYLASRLNGSRDWIWFHEKPIEDVEQISRELGVDFAKPVIGLLTNVFWDAQLHYPANAFKDMLAWVLETIRYFARRPDLQLLIRIHPAEVRGTIASRQPLLAEIQRAFPQLPANVFVIPPESNSSTYAAMYQCDSVLIYGTKTGVELSAVGIPVIVAGEAWVRGKGLTRDANSAEEYFRILDELPVGRRLDEVTTQRARKYAYHFFFRRMIPLPFMRLVEGVPGPYTVAAHSLRELMPGQDLGLDVICDGILKGTPFIYPAEQVQTAVAA